MLASYISVKFRNINSNMKSSVMKPNSDWGNLDKECFVSWYNSTFVILQEKRGHLTEPQYESCSRLDLPYVSHFGNEHLQDRTTWEGA